jgi:tetratricopeptide (TPR) repeat protein
MSMMVAGLLFVAIALAAPHGGGPGRPGRELQRLGSEARTADLRGDWSALLRAHDAIARVPEAASSRAWIEYYLAYVDWRQSSLAFMGQGLPATAACLRHAQEHLTRALDLAPEFTEARLLMVIVDGGTMNADPAKVAELGPRLRANVSRVVADAPDNPRVKYLQAFLGFYVPGRSREQKDAALADWRRAAESFPRRARADEPEWGRAEAWAWLGGTLLVDGKPDQAKDALEHAIADRKDFWWARAIALPQAARMSAAHGS